MSRALRGSVVVGVIWMLVSGGPSAAAAQHAPRSGAATTPSAARPATAAAPAPTPAAPPAPAPVQPAPVVAAIDEVRTQDGALVRGTILESVPQSHVLLQTVGGEIRRFEWSTITYSGPITGTATSVRPDAPAPALSAVGAAPAPAPAAADANGELEVPFESVPGQQLRIYVDRGRPASLPRDTFPPPPQPDCAAPCTVHLTPGWHRLGLSDATHAPSWASERIEIRPGTRLTGDLTSRRGARIGGGITGLVLMAAGAALVGTAHQTVDVSGFGNVSGWIRGRVIGGSVLLATGLTLAIAIPVGMKDKVAIHVTPF